MGREGKTFRRPDGLGRRWKPQQTGGDSMTTTTQQQTPKLDQTIHITAAGGAADRRGGKIEHCRW